MPDGATKSCKIPPRRINEPVPDWARQLLAGERPDQRDPMVENALFGWLIGDAVPGLPRYDTREARRLIEWAGGWPPPPRGR